VSELSLAAAFALLNCHPCAAFRCHCRPREAAGPSHRAELAAIIAPAAALVRRLLGRCHQHRAGHSGHHPRSHHRARHLAPLPSSHRCHRTCIRARARCATAPWATKPCELVGPRAARPGASGPPAHCANGSLWSCAAGMHADSAHWPCFVFLFSRYIHILAKFKKLCMIHLNSESCDTNFVG
jgi:hypothetical protein